MSRTRTLFARRPATVAPPKPEPLPAMGETWQPEGVTVRERYYNQAHAVVLLYTAAQATYYVVACLGCHYATTGDEHRRLTKFYTLENAAKNANEHATTCRALPRAIPPRPDDDTARERLHKWVRHARRRGEDQQLWLHQLDLSRLELQRTNAWIETALQQMAIDQPDTLIAKPARYGSGTDFYARHYPEN